jgi:hypothetical protein
LYVAGDLGRYEKGEISSSITCVESPIDELPVGGARFWIEGEEGRDSDADIQQVGGGGKVTISPDIDQDATLITASDVDGWMNVFSNVNIDQSRTSDGEIFIDC